MNTKFSEIVTYFKTLAAQNVDIAHSATEKHFYRFELDEVLTNLKNVNYPALILEGYRYKLKDQSSDNVLKDRTGAFILIDHLHDIGDFDAMEEIWDNMESICDEIIAKIKSDKRNPLAKAVRDFDLNTVEIALIANTIDQNYGIRCTYTITSPFTTDIDPTKWNLDVDVP
jgi:hypothetical protein